MENIAFVKAIIVAMLLCISQMLVAGDDDMSYLLKNIVEFIDVLNATNKEIRGDSKDIGAIVSSASGDITKQLQLGMNIFSHLFVLQLLSYI
jgi:hypothetical protein